MTLSSTDPIDWVRRMEPQLFPGGKADAVSISAYIMSDVFAKAAGECRIVIKERWQLVASNQDWLAPHDTESLFERVVSEPNREKYSMRAEIIVRAFARDIYVWSPAEEFRICGVTPDHQFIRGALDLEWCRRVIGFRMPENGSTATASG